METGIIELMIKIKRIEIELDKRDNGISPCITNGRRNITRDSGDESGEWEFLKTF